MATKRLFEVSVRHRHEPEPPSKVLFVLADDEDDLQSVGGIGDATIVDVVEIDGRVAAAGPSRVIGWTRRAATALALT